jgi:hypothetical protein
MKKSLRFFFVAALAMMSMSTMAQTTVTFDAATDKGTKTASDPGEDQITKDGVTIAVSNGCMNLTDQYRCYKGATFTVTSTAGNIAKVEISCTAEGTEKYGPGNFTDATAGAYTYEGKVGTWTGDAASFSMTSSTNQVRMNTVVVTLAGGGAEGGTRVWDFTILPTQKVDGTGNLEGNLGDAGVFVEYYARNVDAAGRAASPDDDADPQAVEHARRDRSEQRIIDQMMQLFHVLEQREKQRKAERADHD